MECDAALDLVRRAALARDYVVSDHALARHQQAGHGAADILHALSFPTSCVPEPSRDDERFVITGPSLAGTEIGIVVKVISDRVVVVM